eukprot:COSAG05_NODE_3810_length_1828_cov_0.918450_2_plen_77_part_00
MRDIASCVIADERQRHCNTLRLLLLLLLLLLLSPLPLQPCRTAAIADSSTASHHLSDKTQHSSSVSADWKLLMAVA